MAASNTVLAELANNSVLSISLMGVRTVLEREFGIKNVLLSSNESIKRELARKGNTEYPYAYMQLGELAIVRDKMPNKNIQRHGLRVGQTGVTRATTKKAYLFPVNVAFEFKYVHNDPQHILLIAEAMAIMSGIGGLFFTMNLGEFSLDINVEIPESCTIPLSETGDTTNPGGMEVALQLVLHTHTGFFRDVSAVNSNQPIRSYEIEMHDYSEVQDV